jgi:outer membrane protein, heavy metal efflux system
VNNAWLRVMALGVLGCGGCRTNGGQTPPGDDARVRGLVSVRADVGPVDEGGSARASCERLLAGPLTQAAAVKVALLQNPAVRASMERLGIARADLLQAGLLSNPVFSVDAKFFSAGPEIELGLTQSFVDLFHVPLRRCVAAADLRAAEATVAAELVALVYGARRAFAAVIAAEAVVAARREGALAYATQRDLARTLHEAGNLPAAQRTALEVDAARARMDVADAELAARASREPLYVFLGLSEPRPDLALVGTLDALPGDVVDEPSAVSLAVARSLDLTAACARIESAALAVGLRRHEGTFPALDAGVVGKREADGPWGFGPSLSTALPVFDWGQARVLEGNSIYRREVARHAVLTIEIRSAARGLRDRAVALRERARFLQAEYVPGRARLVREIGQQYDAMQVGAFDVLAARQQEADAERERLVALRDAWLARLDLDELLAGRLARQRATSGPDADASEFDSLAGGTTR